ncbi:methionine import ATP-binding protein MetN [Flexivirga endophytica]|uniref:Methionine import ATP-binding protein MetN n=1 Tax=Flexivirga endophytica TaxID=1849103 RepID=A0A916T4A4_9MICO|nr:methionine ABC transporter ATP-binding protein [Flexivirga endophytica]GGB28317.1 methionine import ATP-binding protein MetN [Flexivirga endophytica]GHB62077.1 methionine import ATP-binding protein MetN [Flexivirga endophytica]
MTAPLAKSTGEAVVPPDTLVRLESVSKVFGKDDEGHRALDDVDLEIRRGEIFAVIGYSGAGKSTLVRLINGLEQTTSGTVTVDGVDITRLRGKPLRAIRRRIGMVFQQFNLMRSRTVFGNVAYPLQLAGLGRAEQEDRVAELLSFVGLLDKAWTYPEELSGGQKQRVGIARALASDPDLLLADESTSALDPETTREVLALLRRVNEELGITIVVITHEMDVVRAIADRVAVLDSGRVVETGSVRDILGAPQSETTQRFVAATVGNRPNADRLQQLREAYDDTLVTVTVTDERALGSVLSAAARRHGVDFEIVYGGITDLKHESIGSFTLALRGPDTGVLATVDALSAAGTVEGATA